MTSESVPDAFAPQMSATIRQFGLISASPPPPVEKGPHLGP